MIVAVISDIDEDVLQTLYNKVATCDKVIELSAREKQILTILTRNMINSMKCEKPTKDSNTK